jgi:hypothetical protein
MRKLLLRMVLRPTGRRTCFCHACHMYTDQEHMVGLYCELCHNNGRTNPCRFWGESDKAFQKRKENMP